MTHGWRRWVRIWRRTPEADVDAEVGFHLEARVEELVAAGQAPDSARARALEEFGDLAAVRTELVTIDRRIAGQRRRADWWEGVWLDLRHVMRGLRRSPGFTVMVAATLALGIGPNAVVFSLLDRLFLQPPAGVAHPDEVRRVVMSQHNGSASRQPWVRSVYSYPEVRSVRNAAPEGVSIAAYVHDDVRLGRRGDAPSAAAAYVVGDYFNVLRLRPVLGRFFAPDEQQVTGLSPVVVVGHDFWVHHLAGHRDILGQMLELGPHRYTIIGVAPDGFRGVSLDAVDLWLPYNTMGSWTGRKADWYEALGTLSLSLLARASSAPQWQRLAASATGVERVGFFRDSTATAALASLNGAPGREFHTAEFSISQRLGGVAFIILLIACANVTNLMLVRALGKRREIAVRLALGVSRRRLVAQFLGEAIVVATIGGAAALVVTWWGAGLLRHTLLPGLNWGSHGVSARVTLFAILMTLMAGVVVGMLPAVQGSRPELTAALKAGAREGYHVRSRTRSALLVLQAALSVVLLAGAGLFVRSLRQVQAIDIGYDSRQLIFASAVPLEDDTARQREIAATLPDLAARLARLPDVERTALAMVPPMSGFTFEDVYIPGADSLPSLGPFGQPIVSFVSPGYFAATGMRIRRGRGFTASDRPGAEQVVVVNELMARSFWPKGDALGSCIMLEKRNATCRRIVGVVTDAHIDRVTEQPAPAYFVPLAQAPAGDDEPGAIIVRARVGQVRAARLAVFREMKSELGTTAVPRVVPMEALLAADFHKWQLGATLFSVAGLLALLVAAVGIYSTIAYVVGQRRHEIGVRIALGAPGTHVARVVVAQGLKIVVVGVLIGVAVALALGKLVASLLYGVTPHDPVVLGAVALVLILVAIAACLVPAWRAARVDPMETLRAE